MMRIFLTACLLMICTVPAFAQDAGEAERMALARKLNEVNPVSRQIEASILRVGSSWGLSEKEKFQKEMMGKIDMPKLENAAVSAAVSTFTVEELKLMIEYYSKPEAAKIMEKMPVYQGLVQPAITKEMDRALMALRSGYESPEKATPSP